MIEFTVAVLLGGVGLEGYQRHIIHLGKEDREILNDFIKRN